MRLDIASAVYEWNYTRQMIRSVWRKPGREIARGQAGHLLGTVPDRRPLLHVYRKRPGRGPVLLDELDRTTTPFEAYLLEVLSDFRVTIPDQDDQGAATTHPSSSPQPTREIDAVSAAACPLGGYPDAQAGHPAAQGARRVGRLSRGGGRVRATPAQHGPISSCRALPKRSTGQRPRWH
jgi:hypothetical protein